MTDKWIPVIVESPFAGDIDTNLRYLRALMRDCIMRGETPYASHGLLTQPGVLNDDNPGERMLGIHAGFAWAPRADYVVVGIDRGVSKGMQLGIDRHRSECRTVIERSLPDWANGKVPPEPPLTHAFRAIRFAVDTLETQMRQLLAKHRSRPDRSLDADLDIINGHLRRAEKAEARVRELEAQLSAPRVLLPGDVP